MNLTRWRPERGHFGAAVVVALTCGVAGCGGKAAPVTAAASSARAAGAASEVTSNILRQDYVGSAACQPCHGDVVAAWKRSPMHRMTRLPEEAEIRAPFDGSEFHFKGDVARLEKTAGGRFVRVIPRDGGRQHLYRVTKVIGGRYREDFAGVEVSTADPGAPIIGDPRAELILPVSYLFQNSSFRLKGYSVMVGERPGLRAGGVWNQTCIFCHNTIPYFDDLWGALHGPGAPGYQGEVVDRVLPAARRLRYAVTDASGLLRALDAEVATLQGSDAAPDTSLALEANTDQIRTGLRRAMVVSRAKFAPSHFIEVGIGCESCHGGSRAHVDDPRLHPTFEPRAPFLAVGRGAAGGTPAPIARAEWQNRACARCHQVLFSRYARTWEGGLRRGSGDPGGSHITSGEARDFLLGGCAQQMACSACHDPHGEDRQDQMARLATPAGNRVCTGCHQSLKTATGLKAHARHDPAGAGGACIGCHMPRKNMGLGYALTRYHRIGSPTDRARVEGDRPLECALCHGDKTIGALLADIRHLWGKRYDQDAILRMYGSLEANALIASIERGYAHEQATAMGAAGEQRLKSAASAIARQRDVNAYPLVRGYAAAALAALDGRPPPPELSDGGDGRRHQNEEDED